MDMSTVYMAPAAVRAARFDGIVTELRTILRRSFPDVSDEAILERAIHIAAFRLAGGNIVGKVLG
jgi:hypothetical protein